MIPLFTRCLAEFLGTLVLVLGGCGSAVFAAAFPDAKANELGIGFLGVSLAFGLTVLIMAYAIGHISGCHLNPAVSFGLWAGRRFPGSELLPYIISQVLGAIFAAGLIYLIASGKPGFTLSGSNPLATNGFAEHSPGGYSIFACFITEVVLTFIFLIVILGSTDGRAPKGFAPIAIGLALTLIHLVSIPITNTSVNPARTTGPALFAGVEMFRQVWMFWIAPILGAILAGSFYSRVLGESGEPVVGEAELQLK
ncbi:MULTISPECIES: aquaporin Z [Calothrix]|uniref:Aquaporin Z n=2 Tax=Calothrix TaxID=1186 RepID=A0ABR8A9I3_9CYAN|nr:MULTISPECIES: aquaporin Z [Calothrix]MBD2196135.1 aquaporin Z [Calothrix parietina FACHB-288]MBD2224786.1 aquaporin Z [Calothrix anomala FACHB-343]